MNAAPPPAVLHAGALFLRWRPAVTLPLQALTLGLVGAQRVDLWVAGLVASSFFVAEAWRARRPIPAWRMAADLVVTVGLIAVAAARTGAAHSPMLPLLLAPVVAASAIFGATRTTAALVALACVALGLMGLAPAGTPLAEDALEVLRPAMVLGTGALLAMVVTGLVSAHARAARALNTAGMDMVTLTSSNLAELEAWGRTVAHEVKNPLTATHGLLELLSEMPLDERARARTAVALSETRRALDLLHGYLTRTRPAAVAQRTPQDLTALCLHVAAVVEAHAQQRGCTVTVTGPRPAVVVPVDGALVRQALLNLVLNAVQAGARHVGVEVEADGNAQACVLRVLDDGHGLSSGVDGQRSTGVGLQVVARVAEAHRGTWNLSPRLPRGAVASLTLSTVQPASDTTTEPGPRSLP